MTAIGLVHTDKANRKQRCSPAFLFPDDCPSFAVEGLKGASLRRRAIQLLKLVKQ